MLVCLWWDKSVQWEQAISHLLDLYINYHVSACSTTSLANHKLHACSLRNVLQTYYQSRLHIPVCLHVRLNVAVDLARVHATGLAVEKKTGYNFEQTQVKKIHRCLLYSCFFSFTIRHHSQTWFMEVSKDTTWSYTRNYRLPSICLNYIKCIDLNR